MTVPLNCANLGKLANGTAGLIIDAAIQEAIRDLDDRGHEDDKARQVIITLTLDKADNGQVWSHIEAMTKIPRRRSAGTLGGIHVQGDGVCTIEFQPLCPEDPRQRHILDVPQVDE